MTKKTLTITFADPLLVGVSVALRRLKGDYAADGHRAPWEWTANTDAEGVATFEDVWCDADGQVQVPYTCFLPDGEQFQFHLSATSPTSIEEIRGLETTSLETNTNFLQALIGTHNESSAAHPALTAFDGRVVTGATTALAPEDSRKWIHCNRGAGVTITLPNSLAVGVCVEIVQTGDGQVTLSAASGASLRHPDSHTKTRAKWSVVCLRVISNVGGSAAEYLLSGDTAA